MFVCCALIEATGPGGKEHSMAYDPGLAQILRDALGGWPVTEKKMFGGLAFLLNGHMVCGVHSGGAMVRVGKAGHA
jgi:hypothetical protein